MKQNPAYRFAAAQYTPSGKMEGVIFVSSELWVLSIMNFINYFTLNTDHLLLTIDHSIKKVFAFLYN